MAMRETWCTLPAVHRAAAALAVVLAGATALAFEPLGAADAKRDYAAAVWSILPPGESGSLELDRNTTDQARRYDALTPLGGAVTADGLRRYFKPARLGLGGQRPRRREVPRTGVTVVRDAFGVAHVTGKTDLDVAFGAGWVTAADRGLLLQLLRGPARVAALNVPGLDPFDLALSGKTFVPSPDTEAFVANQLDALRSQGPLGRRVLALIRAYAAGVNAWYRARVVPPGPGGSAYLSGWYGYVHKDLRTLLERPV